MGGNIAGLKLKLFLIYHAENSWAFTNLSKQMLPVYYQHNKKAWMTLKLFEDMFLNCFIPSVKEYCREKSTPFKIFLYYIMARTSTTYWWNASRCWSTFFCTQCDRIDTPGGSKHYSCVQRVLFMVYVSPSSQGNWIWDNIMKVLKRLSAIKNIVAAWEDVTEQCMKVVWKKILKNYVNNFKGFYKGSALMI